MLELQEFGSIRVFFMLSCLMAAAYAKMLVLTDGA
jgi:hypothetical protein